MAISSSAGPGMRLRPQQVLTVCSRPSITYGVSVVSAGAARHSWAGPMGVARSPTCLAVASLGASSLRVCRKALMRSKVSPLYRQHTSRRLTVTPKAMVNVDFASPSLVLGGILIACGVALLQMRNMQTSVSRDADIVVAAMVSIVGSTLIFQGWRLDPLLLLCQALTTSVAVWYGIETFRLRSREEDIDQQQGGADWGPYGPPDANSMPSNMLPPQQQQQQGGVNKLMGAFMGSKQAAQQQPAVGYAQTGRAASPGVYLPPGQEQQPYPWVEPQQAPVAQYSSQFAQEQELPAPGLQQGPPQEASWQYGSAPRQSNASWGTPPLYPNTNAYYDPVSGQYYDYPIQQQDYGPNNQQGNGSSMPLEAAQEQQYNQATGYSAPQQAAGLLPSAEAMGSGQYGAWPSAIPQQGEGYPAAAPSNYMDGTGQGGVMAGPVQGAAQAQDFSRRGPAAGQQPMVGPASAPRPLVLEKVDDWE